MAKRQAKTANGETSANIGIETQLWLAPKLLSGELSVPEAIKEAVAE